MALFHSQARRHVIITVIKQLESAHLIFIGGTERYLVTSPDPQLAKTNLKKEYTASEKMSWPKIIFFLNSNVAALCQYTLA